MTLYEQYIDKVSGTISINYREDENDCVPSVQKPRVMIVEDQPENISILVELLKEDYQLMPVTSGEAALKRLAKKPLPERNTFMRP